MIGILLNNQEALEKRYAGWKDRIYGLGLEEGVGKYRVMEAKNGDLSIGVEVDGDMMLVHSGYNPRREAKKLIERVEGEVDLLVILGIGLGYILEVALGERRIKHILVCERELWVLKVAFEHRDLSGVILDRRCDWVIGEDYERFIGLLRSERRRNMQLLANGVLEKLGGDYYEGLRVLVKRYAERGKINTATLKRFEKLWMRNVRKNILEFIRHEGVDRLAGEFKGEACVVVGAGPSLRKNIELLKKYQEEVLIIAVDTSFQILKEYGIDSDFVVTIDPQEKNKKYFENVVAGRSILVFDVSVSNRILRGYGGRKIVIGSLFHFVRWLEGLVGKKGELEMGGSVATACYSLGKKLGCDPIILVGLDLAYSDGKTHMKGTYFEGDWFYQSNRLRTPYSLSYGFLNENPLFKVEGYGGGEVKTDLKFESFRGWFEEKFSLDSVRVINATEGGALLKNCINQSFGEVLKKEVLRKGVGKREIEVGELEEWEVRKYVGEGVRGLEGILERLCLIRGKVELGLELSKDLYGLVKEGLFGRGIQLKRKGEIKRELDEIDRVLMDQGLIHGMISLTMQSMIGELDRGEGLSGLEESHEELKGAKQSIQMYEGILESIRFNYGELKKGKLRLERYLDEERG